MEEKKKVSKIKAIVCFAITLVTVYIMYGKFMIFLEWMNQPDYKRASIENSDLFELLKFVGLLLANIISGVVAAFEFKKGHDPDKMSFIGYIFRSPFLLNGIFVWMLFISMLVPSIFIIVFLILGLILGYKGGSSKSGRSSASQNYSTSNNLTSNVTICPRCGSSNTKKAGYNPNSHTARRFCNNCNHQYTPHN